MSAVIKTNHRTTHIITDSDFPDVEFEVSYEPADNTYIDSIKVSRIDDNRVVVGYLSNDDDSRDPLDEAQSDGSGRIYSAHRNSSSHEKMQEALGLDSEWEPDLDIINGVDIDEAYVKLFIENTNVAELIAEHERLEDETDVQYQTRIAEADLNDNYKYNLVFADGYNEIALELWRKGRENGTIGTPYTISLDVYDHGGQVFSISGEGMSCRWDTSRGGAVWVPDEYCLEHIMSQPEADRNECADECCRNALKEYNAWLCGDVYGVCVAICDSKTGEELSSDECWGYYTSEHAIQQMNDEVESAVKWHQNKSLEGV